MRRLSVVLLLLLALVFTACQPEAAPDTEAPETDESTETETQPEEEPTEPAEGETGDEGATETEEGATETEGEGAAETEGAQTVDSFTCEDEVGCVTLAAGDPIKIGYLLVLSGPNESLGVDSRNGIEIAVAERDGEMLGHPIELVGEDDACSAEGGQTGATRLAADQQLLAVVGTSCSSAARTAIPLMSQAGVTMVSPSNTAPELTAEDRGDDHFFYARTAHNDLFQGRVAAEFAYNELGLKSAATIHDGSIYADRLQAVFADTWRELGGEVTSQEAVNVGDTDMRPVLTRIAADQPEIIYYPIFVAEGGFITSQSREVDGLEEVTLMGADGLFSPDFVNAAGNAAAGMYLSGPYVGEDQAYQDFVDLHREMYGTAPPSGFHAHAYDATNIILDAVEEVAVEDADGNLHIPRTELRNAVFATESHEGLTGNLSCSETGDCATGEALAVFELTEEVVQDPDANWPPAPVYQPETE